MRSSPSIVPGSDRDIYLVLDDFGLGRAWTETDEEHTDRETLVRHLMERDGRGTPPRTSPRNCNSAAPCAPRFRAS